MTMQPNFTKPDRNFKAVESLSSSTAATDRSGNESVMRYSKLRVSLKRQVWYC